MKATFKLRRVQGWWCLPYDTGSADTGSAVLCYEGLQKIFAVPRSVRRIEIVLHDTRPGPDSFVRLEPYHDGWRKLFKVKTRGGESVRLPWSASRLIIRATNNGCLYATVHYWSDEA